MKSKNSLTRRKVLTAGMGLAAGAVATAVAGTAMQPTPPNPEGPFYPKHKQIDTDTDLTLIEGHSVRAEGDVIRVTGQVLDEIGQPVEGALVDIWQANCHGRYHHEDDPASAPLDPNFQGWGMVKTDAEGRYAFTTIKPGAYAVDGQWSRPPHIHFKVSRRGYRELTTQMYFAGEPLNEGDRLLQDVPAAERGRLVVDFQDNGGRMQGHFPIVMARVV